MKIFFLLPSCSCKRGRQSSSPGRQKGCLPLSVHSSSDVGKHHCVGCLRSSQQGCPVCVASLGYACWSAAHGPSPGKIDQLMGSGFSPKQRGAIFIWEPSVFLSAGDGEDTVDVLGPRDPRPHLSRCTILPGERPSPCPGDTCILASLLGSWKKTKEGLKKE